MKGRIAAAAAFAVLAGQVARGQTDTAEPAPVIPAPAATPAAHDHENSRILGVIPNYQTVSDPHAPVAPLTAGQKFKLFARETVDPFTFAGAAMGAALSQAHDDDPKYGQGWGPYAQRFGAASVDIATQNFFGDFALASLLHEDPRYFRRGPEYGFWNRMGYALSRIVITRKDSGGETFNYAGIGGMALGITLSNAYYPSRSVNADVSALRLYSSVSSAALGNLLPEFWPDIKQKFLRRRK